MKLFQIVNIQPLCESNGKNRKKKDKLAKKKINNKSAKHSDISCVCVRACVCVFVWASVSQEFNHIRFSYPKQKKNFGSCIILILIT